MAEPLSEGAKLSKLIRKDPDYQKAFHQHWRTTVFLILLVASFCDSVVGLLVDFFLECSERYVFLPEVREALKMRSAHFWGHYFADDSIKNVVFRIRQEDLDSFGVFLRIIVEREDPAFVRHGVWAVHPVVSRPFIMCVGFNIRHPALQANMRISQNAPEKIPQEGLLHRHAEWHQH